MLDIQDIKSLLIEIRYNSNTLQEIINLTSY